MTDRRVHGRFENKNVPGKEARPDIFLRKRGASRHAHRPRAAGANGARTRRIPWAATAIRYEAARNVVNTPLVPHDARPTAARGLVAQRHRHVWRQVQPWHVRTIHEHREAFQIRFDGQRIGELERDVEDANGLRPLEVLVGQRIGQRYGFHPSRADICLSIPSCL